MVVLSSTLKQRFYTKGNNWVTGSKTDQSAYCSELAGIIAVLTTLEVLVHHYDLTSESVTIALDGESELIQSGRDWPLSVDQSSFDYLQVISGWIKLSSLLFQFCHVKGHPVVSSCMYNMAYFY